MATLTFKDLVDALQGASGAITGVVVDVTRSLSMEVSKLAEQSPPDQQADFQLVLGMIGKLQSDVVTSVQAMNPLQATPTAPAPVVSAYDDVPVLDIGPTSEDHPIPTADLEEIELPIELSSTPPGVGVDGAIAIDLVAE